MAVPGTLRMMYVIGERTMPAITAAHETRGTPVWVVTNFMVWHVWFDIQNIERKTAPVRHQAPQGVFPATRQQIRWCNGTEDSGRMGASGRELRVVAPTSIGWNWSSGPVESRSRQHFFRLRLVKI